MGKSIIQQARGHGSLTYRVRRRAYRFEIKYPMGEGIGKVIKLVNSPGHSAPLAKILLRHKIYYNQACKNMVEGQDISFGGIEVKDGNVLQLKDIPTGTNIYNLEVKPNDGGKLVRAGAVCALVTRKIPGKVGVMMPSKKEVFFDEKARATIGTIAGEGRLDKPIIKAGKMHHMMKARNKMWPQTSAVKVNAIDHPFGSGRGKRIKSKIAKRNAPAGARVGLLRPKRTGRKKR